MKKTIYLYICSVLILFSCEKQKQILTIAENEETQANITAETNIQPEVLERQQAEIQKEIKDIKDLAYYFPIEEDRDIFTGLFDDIKDVNHNEWGDGFTVRYERPSDRFSPEEMYIVENETIAITFYNIEEVSPSPKARERMEERGRRLTGFVALDVLIKKNTDEYRLGKYIGENINDVLNNFDNQYQVSSDDVRYGNDTALYFLRLYYKDDNMQAMGITFFVSKPDNNTITKIVYGYGHTF